MKKKKFALPIVLSMVFVMCMFTLTACKAKPKSYTKDYTDGDTYVATAIPFHCVSGDKASYAFNMMGLTKVTVDVKFNGSEYTFVTHDVGNTDSSNAMYWDRTTTFTGALSESNGTYTLAVPTKVTKVLKYGSSFAEYKSIWGDQGTYTEADKVGQDLLKQFVACTATVKDTAVTFDVPKSATPSAAPSSSAAAK